MREKKYSEKVITCCTVLAFLQMVGMVAFLVVMLAKILEAIL